MATAPQRHPIGLIVTDDLHRRRLTVFFRIVLAIPHLIALYVFGFFLEWVALVAWIVTLVLGRLPLGLHDLLSGYLRYLTRVSAYLLLLAEPWPRLSVATYPVDLRIDPPLRQNRLGVLFRLLLAIPALVLAAVFRAVNTILAIFSWFYCLFAGRMHEGMEQLSAWMLGFESQTYGYLLMLTSRYPSLAGAPRA